MLIYGVHEIVSVVWLINKNIEVHLEQAYQAQLIDEAQNIEYNIMWTIQKILLKEICT